MPIQTPQWTEFLTCPICCNEFEKTLRRPISLGCGHTMCKACLSTLHKTQCPFDQASVSIDIDKLPVNTALLKLVGAEVTEDNVPDIPCIQENKSKYLTSMRKIEELAMFLKSTGTTANGTMASASNTMNGITGLNRPMQRKLVNLVNCQLAEEEGRTRVMRAARSLGERTVTELMLLHQNPQQLSANLWAAVRNRGCQFLGPAMQEEALKLILLALEGGESLCRKVLVLFVVQKLENVFPQASKTSIGHVVQLLYRASCFVVTKRDDDSSLMQLKEQFRTYDALRREHDAQIVQIAMEAGLRISPEQWSSVLYGDSDHKSHMQSIIDKLQTPQSFSQSIVELIFALQRSNDPGELIKLRPHFELLSNIDASPEAKAPEWDELEEAMNAVHAVVSGLVNFSRVYGTKMKGTVDQPQPNHNHSKYKTSMCRDYQKPGGCPRGSSCSFAHSEEELEKFGRRKPNKGKGGIVARGPSSMSSDISYSSMENGLDQTANTGSPQSQHMNGSARSSPCELAPVNSYGQPQTQYRRVNQDQTMPQRIKQMNLHSPPGYSSPGPYDGRMSYPTNGERANGYYYPTTNGFTPAMVPRDMKGVAGPPGIITPPSSSPLTIQDDMNGSRENGMTNGHVENGMGRRLAHGRQFDPNPRRRTQGYVFEPGYGGYDAYFPSNGYPPQFRHPHFHDPYHVPMTNRPDACGFDYVCQPAMYEPRPEYIVEMNGMANMNGRIGEVYRTRRPYIPDDRELQDSPRTSDLSEESDHLDQEWFRARRKDTTMSNTSSGVSSGSPLSRSPTASQASSSSLSPRQDSPVIWQIGGDGDKILETYRWSTTNEVNEVNKSIKELWQQPLVDRRSTFSRHDQDQISSDALFALRLQEEENKSLLETKSIDNGESLLRQRRELEEQERLKVRREQEENDRRIALEAQAFEEEDEMKRTTESEHDRLYKERMKLLAKQNKEHQERKDRKLAQQIAFEDAKNHGLVPTRPIGYNSSLIPRGSTSCRYHGTRDVRPSNFSAFGSIGSYRNGCSPLYGEDDVVDSPRHTCREDVITFTG